MSLDFDAPVPDGGYAWWYLDGWSDDGSQGLTLIAFVGSVFSPYYAHARRRRGGKSDPLQHCAFNLALYSAPGAGKPTGWCMTERSARQVQRRSNELRIGPSALQVQGHSVTASIDEIAVPWPRRLRGTIALASPHWHTTSYALDPQARHHWRPHAPCARLQVDFGSPQTRWSGWGYLDGNRGERPLAEDFARWDWSRATLGDGRAAVAYDVQLRSGEERRLALAFEGGHSRALAPSPRHALPDSAWRIPRFAAAEHPAQPALVQTLEDGPFYARSRARSQFLGEPCMLMHESLSMPRWQHPVVQAMLPFRMPRRP